MQHTPTRSTPTRRGRRAPAALLVAALCLVTACGDPADTPAPTETPTDRATQDAATDTGDEVATTGTDTADGREGGGETADAVPPYDSENQRSTDSEGTPEPCLLLTPALVASIHGPFDMQLLLNGPICNYISAAPLFDVSLHTAPPSFCDQIVDDATTLGRSVEDETIDGRIVSWTFSEGAGSALIYDGDWCFHLNVLHAGSDRPTMTRYVEAITDALG
jgi:hypothetical protein